MAKESITIPTTVQVVLGGSGADTITVPSSTTTSTYLFGGDETAPAGDTINGGGGSDYIWGGAGNDVMNGGAGNDMFFERSTYQITGASATVDPDPLQSVASGYWDGLGSVVYGILDAPGKGADLVNGGTGNQDRVDLSDTIPGALTPITVTICDDTSTAVSLTAGSAWMTGCGNATAGSMGAVYGNDDYDGITAGNNYANVQWISGGTGTTTVLSNILIGTSAAEILEGGVGLDVILGQGGNDTIYGYATGQTDPSSVDVLCGGDDEDQIFGGGSATIDGEGQMVATGAVSDVLPGSAGGGGAHDPELCFGAKDTNSLDPGAGADICNGAKATAGINQYWDCLNQAGNEVGTVE
jgi:Ca2+-binding RTX toxin-like protein